MDPASHPMVCSRETKTGPEIAAGSKHCDGGLLATLQSIYTNLETEAEFTVSDR